MIGVALTVFDIITFYIAYLKKGFVNVTEYNFRTDTVRWQM